MNYILVDTANTFFRSKFAIQSDLDSKIGMALHITFNSIRKVWQDFKGDHVVFCLEGRSWRKDFYEPYKRNRKNVRDARTEKEIEEDEVFWETFDNFKDFIDQKTNCTVLQNPKLEADDLIAGWVQAHPNDNHFIIFLKLILSVSTIYFFGVLLLGTLIGWDKPILELGVMPFLLAEVFKISLLFLLTKKLFKLRKFI